VCLNNRHLLPSTLINEQIVNYLFLQFEMWRNSDTPCITVDARSARGVFSPRTPQEERQLTKEAKGEMKRLLVVAVSAAVLVFAGGSTAFAGEVKGPPNQLNNNNDTGALEHANSACAASGLNDFDLSDPDGQTVSQVQTAADSWKYYGLPKGSPGTLCKGGTGLR